MPDAGRYNNRNIRNVRKGGYEMEGHDYTTAEVADRLRVTPAAVTAWCRSGLLPAYRAGKGWRIRKEDLDKFIRRGVPQSDNGQRLAASV